MSDAVTTDAGQKNSFLITRMFFVRRRALVDFWMSGIYYSKQNVRMTEFISSKC